MKNENKTFILLSFLTSQTLNYWELLFCVFVIKNLFIYVLRSSLMLGDNRHYDNTPNNHNV